MQRPWVLAVVVLTSFSTVASAHPDDAPREGPPERATLASTEGGPWWGPDPPGSPCRPHCMA